MSKILDFNLTIPISSVKRLETMANHSLNYYTIENYGDWFYGPLNILKQEYSELYNCFSYDLGVLEDGEFVSYLSWTITEDIFN